MPDIKLILGDCLDIMPTLPENSVDAIITDLPYGTTACKWDTIIPFDDLWRVVKHVLKPKGAFVTTASQPFTSALVMSNVKWFRYCNYWIKSPVGFLNAKKMPLLNVEDVAVFCDGYTTYNPQGLERVNLKKKNGKSKSERGEKGIATHNGGRLIGDFIQEFTGYPRQTINVPTEKGLHPTQKPVALYEYLIKTYTNEGETVLDICMGSGTTGVACKNLGRNFIGIEKYPTYFEIAEKRINA
jgi:site-specific DNA-methyltransferase (adenine-specific)